MRRRGNVSGKAPQGKGRSSCTHQVSIEVYKESDKDARVGAEVEEELQEGEANYERSCAQAVEHAGHDAQEQRLHEEAHNLDRLASESLDGEHSNVVAGDETQGGNDNVADGDLPEALPGCASLAIEADLLEYDVLVQVDAVESNVKEELQEGLTSVLGQTRQT